MRDAGPARGFALERLFTPVWNERERRPRALIRLGVHGACLIGTAIACGVLRSLGGPSPALDAFAFGAQGLMVLATSAGCARFVDRRPVDDLGLRWGVRGWLDLMVGAAISALCIGAVAVVESSAGWARYTWRGPDVGTWFALGVSVGVFVLGALLEEVAFRGYQLRNLAEGLAVRGPGGVEAGIVAAVLASSLAFGLAHAGNPHVTLLSVLNIALGGVFLSVGRIVRGHLAMPMGAHVAWNFMQNVLDMPVSGQTLLRDAALLRRVVVGPTQVTGGAFGPEGGWTGFAAIAFGTALSLAWLGARSGGLRFERSMGQPPMERRER